MFLDRFMNLWNVVGKPRFWCDFVNSIVFPFRLLVRQSCLAQSSPNRVVRKVNPIFFPNHPVQASDCRQIALEPELRRPVKNNRLEFRFYYQFPQFARVPACRSSFEPCDSVCFETFQPTIDREPTNTIHLGHRTLGDSVRNGLQRPLSDARRNCDPSLMVGDLSPTLKTVLVADRVKSSVTFFRSSGIQVGRQSEHVCM